jgi:hypothetical protein
MFNIDQFQSRIDDLCVNFERSKGSSVQVSVDACREGLLSIFGRFENSPSVYFSVGTGWFPLLFTLNKKLSFLDPNYRILQVKEKFSGLRFYAFFSDISPTALSICDDLIRVAEFQSTKTCEICGCVGFAVEKNGYVSTRCKLHGISPA